MLGQLTHLHHISLGARPTLHKAADSTASGQPHRRDFGLWFFQYVFAAAAATIVSGAIAERAHEDPTERNPILLSYLDTVVQGFLTHWGRNGVDRFFASTDGWSAPILNDRDAPIYSRVQRTTEAERDLVDALLESVNARPFQSATPENTWSDA